MLAGSLHRVGRMEGTGLLAGMRPRSADGGPLRRGSVTVCRLRVWGSRLVLPGFEERPRLAAPPEGTRAGRHALWPSPPLPAHPRRLSGYSVARNDLHRAGGGNFDRTPVTSTRVATGERRRGEVSTKVAEPIVYIIHRGDSRRYLGHGPESVQDTGLDFSRRPGQQSGPTVVPNMSSISIGTPSRLPSGTGSIRGNERLWGPRLDWRCSMRPTCCRTICSSRSSLY